MNKARLLQHRLGIYPVIQPKKKRKERKGMIESPPEKHVKVGMPRWRRRWHSCDLNRITITYSNGIALVTLCWKKNRDACTTPMGEKEI